MSLVLVYYFVLVSCREEYCTMSWVPTGPLINKYTMLRINTMALQIMMALQNTQHILLMCAKETQLVHWSEKRWSLVVYSGRGPVIPTLIAGLLHQGTHGQQAEGKHHTE
jgi:hypothetical protein